MKQNISVPTISEHLGAVVFHWLRLLIVLLLLVFLVCFLPHFVYRKCITYIWVVGLEVAIVIPIDYRDEIVHIW